MAYRAEKTNISLASCRVFATWELTVPRRRALRERIGKRIARRRDDVFLTREFRDLGGEDQVLRGLVREGALVRLGCGVYGRAETSGLSGRPMLAARGGFIDVARQALDKLSIVWGADRVPRRPVTKAARRRCRSIGSGRPRERPLRASPALSGCGAAAWPSAGDARH
jgi:hypothetical protein